MAKSEGQVVHLLEQVSYVMGNKLFKENAEYTENSLNYNSA